MKTQRNGAVASRLNTLFNLGAIRDLTDGQLLERFSTTTGEVAELAFAALVERHGAMVTRVCRSQLSDLHDTQDAFQVTFLVLLKKAKRLWVQDSIGPWLHQVAFRTARCARANSARRQHHERLAIDGAVVESQVKPRCDSDIEAILHDEINRLPERYRLPIILCDLQGFSCEEAARRMGRSLGTVKSWRFRARERLRNRLSRKGTNPSAHWTAAIAGDFGWKATQGRTVDETVRIAARVFQEGMASEGVSASTRILAKGVLKMFRFQKLRTAGFVLALFTSSVGAAVFAFVDDPRGKVDDPKADRSAPLIEPSRRNLEISEESKPVWNLTLREAIRIGLGNAEGISLVSISDKEIRVKRTGGLNDVDSNRVRAELMATVRSTEQQYWALSQTLAALWGAEKVVEITRTAALREKEKEQAGKAESRKVEEANLRFEEAELNLVARTSDVITTERQLRKLLGLPAADSRRIIPVTAPTLAKLEPDWDDSLAEMLLKQPDIAMAEADVKAEKSEDGVVKRSARLEEVIHQTTHGLARFFLDLDSTYKQLQVASKQLVERTNRFEEARKSYEAGDLGVVDFLDSLNQYVASVSKESYFKLAYNTSIVAFEEAKGTLLDDYQIVLVKTPRSVPSELLERLRRESTERRNQTLSPPPIPPTPKPIEPKS